MLARPLLRRLLLPVALTTVLCLAGCTKSDQGPAPATLTQTQTVTHTRTPSIGPTGPVSTGKITEKKVTACPYLGKQSAASTAGMRLDKITELIQDAKTVGCRFYPLEHPGDGCDASCLAAENLPPGNQLAIEILSTKFASALAANNALVHVVEQGTNPQTDKITSVITAGCYQTTVWAHDPKGKEWACGFSKGSTMVVIRTVVNDPALNVVEIAKAIAGKF